MNNFINSTYGSIFMLGGMILAVYTIIQFVTFKLTKLLAGIFAIVNIILFGGLIMTTGLEGNPLQEDGIVADFCPQMFWTCLSFWALSLSILWMNYGRAIRAWFKQKRVAFMRSLHEYP